MPELRPEDKKCISTQLSHTNEYAEKRLRESPLHQLQRLKEKEPRDATDRHND
jgi:hypothetical protein